MPIDMRGWSVVYENQVYRCLQVEISFSNGGRDEHGIELPTRLRVIVIDHEAQIMVIEHYASRFQFIREAPPHE